MNDLMKLFERLVVALETIASNQNPQPVTASATQPVKAEPEATPEVEKPKRTRKKAEPKPEPVKAEPKPEPEQVEEVEEEATFDYAFLQKAIIDLAKSGEQGKKEAIAILTARNVKRASDADPKHWEAMYDEAISALEKLQDADFDIG